MAALIGTGYGIEDATEGAGIIPFSVRFEPGEFSKRFAWRFEAGSALNENNVQTLFFNTATVNSFPGGNSLNMADHRLHFQPDGGFLTSLPANSCGYVPILTFPNGAGITFYREVAISAAIISGALISKVIGPSVWAVPEV